MTLRRLQVTDFRCLQQVELEPDPGFTFICGPNACGKTSLLEAMYLLGRGRSFRTRRLEHVLRHGRDRFVVFGEVERQGRLIPLGIEGSSEGMRARIDAHPAVSLAELAQTLPSQIIDPEVHKLIEDGPARRRRFLDWGVFHVEPDFIGHWQKYQQALKQRNAALKARQPRTVTGVWDIELIRHGEILSDARARYLESLAPHVALAGRRLLHCDVRLQFKTGWQRGIGLSEALNDSWESDRERGSTLVGPQRAELLIYVDGILARDLVSRGQQKLLASALLLAQLELLTANSSARPLLLLDDPAAELDSTHLSALMDQIREQPVQLVVTALAEDFGPFGTPGRRLRFRGASLQPF
jgi:DNA replication and repair protein RecF